MAASAGGLGGAVKSAGVIERAVKKATLLVVSVSAGVVEN